MKEDENMETMFYIIVIEEANYLNVLSIEYHIVSFHRHHLDLDEGESQTKPKSISLKSKGKKTKSMKFKELEYEEPIEASENDDISFVYRKV